MRAKHHPIREADMRKNSAIPTDLLTKLPDVSGVVFPSLAQLNAAKEIIAANWDTVVGADTKAAP
jgi:putative spermidine/putrescine transport system substrate-binding protein